MKIDFRFLGLRLDVDQRKAFLIIGSLIFVAIFTKSLVHHFVKPAKYHFQEKHKHLLAQLQAKPFNYNNEYTNRPNNQYQNKIYQKNNFENKKEQSDKKWFTFDPNTIGDAELLSLPLPTYVANNIIKYRSTGAKFKDLDHFSKVYGIAPFIDDLKNYVQITPLIAKQSENTNSEFEDKKLHSKLAENTKKADTIQIEKTINFEPFNPKKESNIKVDINQANMYELMQIKGIGEWYAKKLIAIRDKLGGFIHKDQIYELSEIPSDRLDAFIESILIDPSKIKKWKINRALNHEIYGHPYLDNRQAKILILYRMHHNGIKNLNQLRDVKVFAEAEIKKLEPYMDFSIE